MKHIITVLVIAFIIVNPLLAGSYDKRTTVPLKQGVLLVATPELSDPNFIHTVILLVSYGKEGALGLIVNRPAGIHLKQALPEIEGIGKEIFPVYPGGPVNRDILFILFTSDEPPGGAQKIFDHLYFADRRDVIIPMLESQNIKNKVRVYAGYAGWASGQLEHEIMRGSWITMEGNLETVFTDDPYSIWPSIFKIPEDILVRIFYLTNRLLNL